MTYTRCPAFAGKVVELPEAKDPDALQHMLLLIFGQMRLSPLQFCWRYCLRSTAEAWSRAENRIARPARTEEVTCMM